MSLLNPPVVLTNPQIVSGNQIITTTFVPRMLIPIVDMDSGVNDNYFSQKQITEWLWYRILDKWLYDEELCYILKYLKIKDGKVSIVSSIDEYKNNKICSDSVEDVEKKADFIEENLLDMSDMRKLMIKVVNQLGYKWFDLPEKESLVVEVVGKYLRKKIKRKIPDAV